MEKWHGICVNRPLNRNCYPENAFNNDTTSQGQNDTTGTHDIEKTVEEDYKKELINSKVMEETNETFDETTSVYDRRQTPPDFDYDEIKFSTKQIVDYDENTSKLEYNDKHTKFQSDRNKQTREFII